MSIAPSLVSLALPSRDREAPSAAIVPSVAFVTAPENWRVLAAVTVPSLVSAAPAATLTMLEYPALASSPVLVMVDVAASDSAPRSRRARRARWSRQA